MNVKLYKIKCLTNMHVGNGDVNFNIIDCEVERDPVTGYPTINASGVKGALRAHFEDVGAGAVDDIFGKANDKSDTESSRGGKVKFLCANMLALPMRVSQGDSPYALITTKTALEQLKSLCGALCARDIAEPTACDTLWVEGVPCSEKVTVFGEALYVMDKDSFDNIPLPVVARNCLESGRENLWYEEIVPHEAVMYFFTISVDAQVLDTFDDVIKKNTIVQFGGNASIGYGICKVEEV